MRIGTPTVAAMWLGCAGSGLSVPPPDDSATLSPPDTAPPVTADSGTEPEDTTTDTGTGETSPEPTTDTAPPPWRHTIVIDGDPSDFLPEETFATSSGTVGLTWDDTHLYIGVNHPDVSGGGPEHWVLVYLGDGATGTTSGVQFNTQQPALPTPFTHLLRWKADGSWSSWMTWDGGTWQDTPSWLGTAGSSYAEDEGLGTVEFAVPLAAFGGAGSIAVHLGWVYEGSGYESSYAPVPADSFVDGYDPDYTAWYAFDPAASDPPATIASSP